MKPFLSIIFFLFSSFGWAQLVPKQPKPKIKPSPTKAIRNAKPEIRTQYWDEGKKQKKSDESYLNGRLHGKCSYWFENGKIARTGWYYDGKVDSSWAYFYDDGQKKAEEYYYQGMKYGPAKYWYKNGQQAMICRFIADLPDSTWNTWHENGKLKAVENYTIVWRNFKWNSLRNGEFNYFTENGLPENAGRFVLDTLDGPYSVWHASGNKKEVGTYAHGQKTGRWAEWYPNGKPLRELE
jgi:antitoxin component YwqK of YwqJK toxin-antitoxin module